MDTLQVIKDIGSRNNGDIYLGVVGPVRVGKSTFIKRFMEAIVLDSIDSEEEKKRAIDELPQSGDGKTIMTMEPKFIPSNAVSIKVDENLYVKVRLIDCVGFIIETASGYLEDGKMRMVKTPWFNETIPFDEAAKIGTKKVITDHSTLGIVIVSDGSISDFTRNDYLEAEKRVINEVKEINKPFVILVNSRNPNKETTISFAKELELKYEVPVIPIDIEKMTKDDASNILKSALFEYPIDSIDISLPKWVSELDSSHYIKISIKESLEMGLKEASKVKDVEKISKILKENEYIIDAFVTNVDTGTGVVSIRVDIDESLYETVLEELVGCKISDKSELIKILTEFTKAKKDYDLIGEALQKADLTGYGFAASSIDTMHIEEPSLSKMQGRYAIKVKAKTSTYHIIKVDVNTTFEPVLGSKSQADYFLDYLMKAYEEDEKKLLDCEMFGRKFKDIFNESIALKLNGLPEPVKIKLQQLIKTLCSKGKGNLIAFVF